METAQSSDDSCDSEMRLMKNELIEFGLDEENLTKEEISDLLKALKNSKSTEKQDEIARDKVENNCNSTSSSSSLPKKPMKRRYLNVRDRRLPWSLLPTTITPAEKARTLAIYIKLMSLNNYRQARQSANFAVWPPPIQIVEETTRVQPMRSTRSGRSVPVYDFDDDDSSDVDLTITKSKKRKVSNCDHNGTDGIYTNKVLSLKRKPPKEENNVRSVKEAKMETKLELVPIGNPVKPRVELFSLNED